MLTPEQFQNVYGYSDPNYNTGYFGSSSSDTLLPAYQYQSSDPAGGDPNAPPQDAYTRQMLQLGWTQGPDGQWAPPSVDPNGPYDPNTWISGPGYNPPQQPPPPVGGGTPPPPGNTGTPPPPGGQSTGVNAPPATTNAPATPTSPIDYNGPTAPNTYSSSPAGVYSGQAPLYTASNGESLQYKAENDRALAMGRGEAIDTGLINYLGDQSGRAANYETQANQAYAPIAAGQGGYTAEQKAAINDPARLASLATSPEQLQQNYLNEGEQANIAGDPYAPYRQLGQDEQSIDAATTSRGQAVRGALNTQDTGIDSAVAGGEAGVHGAVANQVGNTNTALNDLRSGTRGAFSNESGNVNNAVKATASNVRGAIDPNELNTSEDYMRNYQFTPQNEQDIVTKAGRTAGNEATANEDLLQRQAVASGNASPLALQVARQRQEQTGLIAGADAETNARIEARRLGLDTTQTRESTRLGAAQNLANLETGTEMQLGQQNTAAQEDLGKQQIGVEQGVGGSELGAAATLGAAEQGAEQYLANQNVQAQQFKGAAHAANEQTLGAANVASETGKTAMNLGAGQAAEATGSARAGDVAKNRQTVNAANDQTQYQQNLNAYNTEAGANKNFADVAHGDTSEYRNYLANEQNQASQNVSVGQQQRIADLGTQAGATNAATGNAIANYKVPSATEKALGFLAKGGVTHGPREALVGEAGPELIIDLDEMPHYDGGGVVDSTGQMIPGSDIAPDPIAQGDPNGQMYGPHPLKANPLALRLFNALHGSPYGSSGAQDPNAPAQQSGKSGGMLGKAVNIASLFMAHGGLVTPGHPYGHRGMSHTPHFGPHFKAELVTRPEVRTLGAHGPQAILPLTPRPGNNVTPGMLPELFEKYGSHHYGA